MENGAGRRENQHMHGARWIYSLLNGADERSTREFFLLSHKTNKLFKLSRDLGFVAWYLSTTWLNYEIQLLEESERSFFYGIHGILLMFSSVDIKILLL